MKKLLECRGMTWEENCDFDDFTQEIVSKEPNITVKQFIRKAAKWIIENVYKVDINIFTAAEVLLIYNTTKELTDVVREEEIKNLKPLVNGSEAEEATAQTAENSENA